LMATLPLAGTIAVWTRPRLCGGEVEL